jgi:glycosyltransferase involved in cell wall biosynthesis
MLPALIDTLLAQQTAGVSCEVLIVDNASTDSTREIVAAYTDPRLQYLFEPRRGASNARNTGVQHARADIIAFVDDDVVPDPDWVCRIKQTMDAHPDVDCIGGRVEPRWPSPPPRWLTTLNYGPLALQLGRGSGRPLNAANASGCLVSANFACRRDVLREVGGFSRAYLRDEDRELNLRLWRAGKVGIYLDEIRVTARVQAERLCKRYHRHWHAETGVNHARMRYREIIARDGRLIEPVTRHALFGTPAFIYREVLRESVRVIVDTVRRHPAEAFAAECRVRYLLSYIMTRAREHRNDVPPRSRRQEAPTRPRWS